MPPRPPSDRSTWGSLANLSISANRLQPPHSITAEAAEASASDDNDAYDGKARAPVSPWRPFALKKVNRGVFFRLKCITGAIPSPHLFVWQGTAAGVAVLQRALYE